jgi:cytosine/uracil/thiamine/allantoin permease
MLHCNRCNRPICIECAVLTPTGYRCKECVRSQQKVYETAQTFDYVLAAVLACILGYVGSYITILGFFTIFLAPVAGIIIAEAVRYATRRRRSKLLFQITAGAAALGSLPRLLSPLLIGLLAFSGGGLGSFGFALLPLVWQGLFTFLVTSTVYYRLSGIRMG